MAIYYILLFLSAAIFSFQFLITKQYQMYNGSSFKSTIKLSFLAYSAIAIFFFIKGCIAAKGFIFGFSYFTFLMTLGIAVVAVASVYMGIKVLAIGDMSIYSVFMMLGGLILPTITGLFYGEKMTILKGVAIVIMFVAILFSIGSVDKKKFNAKALFYYIGIFLMNGSIGVFFTMHQNNAALTAGAIQNSLGVFVSNNDIFMTWYGLSTVILTGITYVVLIIVEKVKKKKGAFTEKVDLAIVKDKKVASKGILIFLALIPVLYGISNGLGDYFIALATVPGRLGSSVTFPIINGGTILISTIIGWIMCKEKIKVKVLISLALVIISTVMFMFV